MNSVIALAEEIHPNKSAVARFQGLVGIDPHKEAIVTVLASLLAPEKLDAWLKKHHSSGLPFFEANIVSAPLIILSGDVGCGKTALASSVASAVAKQIDDRITVLETPSNIRGNGMVGDLSLSITGAFEQARRKAANGPVILIVDESDDVATSREQNQAHHEDRAGVNVLLKQIDLVGRERVRMAVIMITNREEALDPAVRRRSALTLNFTRPSSKARRALLVSMLQGVEISDGEIDELTHLTSKEIAYTYSDLTDRIGKLALRMALKADKPLSVEVLKEAISQVNPSPLFQSK